MIRINLLPAEKRKAERTPLRSFALIVADAAVVTILLVLSIFIVLKIDTVESQIKELKQEKHDLEPYVKKHDELLKRRNEIEAQVREIRETTARKIEWWRAVDTVWEVIHANPKVWVTGISTMTGGATASAAKTGYPDYAGNPPYGLAVQGLCAGKDLSSLLKFRMDLKTNTDLKKWFSGVNMDVINPDVSFSYEPQPEYLEQYTIPFQIKLIGKEQLPGGGR